MAEAAGPTHLLEVCNQKFSDFLFNAEHKSLAWLREIEEEALKMFNSSNFSVEPDLMPKTPSQKKQRKKKRSLSLKDDHKELTRKRLSRRRSNIKLTSFQRLSQNNEELKNLSVGLAASPSGFKTRSLAKESSEVQCDNAAIFPAAGEVFDTDSCQNVEFKGSKNESMSRILETSTVCSGGHSAEGAGDTETAGVADSTVLVLSDTVDPIRTEGDWDASRLMSTSTPKASLDGRPTCGGEEFPAEEPGNDLVQEGELSQDLKDSTGIPGGSQSGHCPPNRPHKNNRVSLVEKYSLSEKRKSMIRKSISRTIAKKKAARDSSASSQAVVPWKYLWMMKPANTGRSEAQTDFPVTKSEDSAQLHPPEQSQNSRRQSYQQALDELPAAQHAQDENLSFSNHKTTSSLAKKVLSPSGSAKITRPFKNFFQNMQKNQLLVSPGSSGHSSIMKSLIKRNTPTRADPKEKERQRLESLRKKQEAEQQRKQKVEEEKRRRLEEMKLKREERLRKALQARERVEQMEEEKKRRMEQKFSQHEERVREEEKTKKKVSTKKMWEVEARKQKGLQVEDEQKLQEQPEKWKTVGEIKKMLEYNSMKQEKERINGQQDKEKWLKPLEVVAEEEGNLKEDHSPAHLEQLPPEKRAKQTEAVLAASQWQNITAQKSPVGNSSQANPQNLKDPSFKHPKVNLNDYGMDLNSDDSTDDENQPRKPTPPWANGLQLNEAVTYQYYNPPDINRFFGQILSPKLEDIFYKSKPRYFKRTSSAVWQSPPLPGTKTKLRTSNSMKR